MPGRPPDVHRAASDLGDQIAFASASVREAESTTNGANLDAARRQSSPLENGEDDGPQVQRITATNPKHQH